MSLVKSAKAKTLTAVSGVSAMVLSMPASAAGWVDDAKSGLQTAFGNAETVAAAIVVGFAVIFGIKLVKGLLR